MAQCPRCKTLTPYIDRHLKTCGSFEERDRDVSRFVAGVPSGKDRRQALLSHLVAVPGMLIFLVGITDFGIISILSPHIVALLIYRWNHPNSEIVATHTTEALNFQVLWTVAMWAAMIVVPFFGLTLWPVVWIAGLALVFFKAIDVANYGKARYPVRIRLFYNQRITPWS